MARRAGRHRPVRGRSDRRHRAGSIEAHLVTLRPLPGPGGRRRPTPAALDARGWPSSTRSTGPARRSVERVARRLGIRARHRPRPGRHPLAAGIVAAGGGRRLRLRHPRRPAGTDRGLALFLVVAPLIPVAGVAAAFGPGLDPTWEITVAAPGGGFRLLLLRAAAVFATTFAMASVASLALPGLLVDGGRLGPARPRPHPRQPGPFHLHRPRNGPPPPSPSRGSWPCWAAARESRDVLSAFGADGQLGLAAVAVVAAVLVARRRDAFEIRSQL